MNQPLHAEKRELAKRLILEELNAVERVGAGNCFTAIGIAEAAVMHGDEKLVGRGMDWLSLVLQLTSDNSFRGREVASVVDPARLHFRAYTDDEFLRYVKSVTDDAHIGACISGDYASAMSLAESERACEEVGLTFAMLGKLSLARRVVEEADLPGFRRFAIINQIVIRRILDSNFQGYAHEQEVADVHRFGWRIEAALLLLGYFPFPGYPYPDW